MTGFNSKRDAAADKLQEPVREALKLALEAMEYMAKIRDCQREAGYPLSDADKCLQKAITAIKEALAQPPLPVQRQPLTDEEIIDHFQTNVDTGSLLSFADGVRYAEAAHNIGAKS